jgi:hypothetical protein
MTEMPNFVFGTESYESLLQTFSINIQRGHYKRTDTRGFHETLSSYISCVKWLKQWGFRKSALEDSEKKNAKIMIVGSCLID